MNTKSGCLPRLVLFGIVAMLCWLIVNNGKSGTTNFSLDDFENISIGMHYEQVEKMLGSQGEQKSVTGSMETRVYQIGTFGRVTIVYDGGLVAAKAQSGLH